MTVLTNQKSAMVYTTFSIIFLFDTLQPLFTVKFKYLDKEQQRLTGMVPCRAHTVTQQQNTEVKFPRLSWLFQFSKKQIATYSDSSFRLQFCPSVASLQVDCVRSEGGADIHQWKSETDSEQNHRLDTFTQTLLAANAKPENAKDSRHQRTAADLNPVVWVPLESLVQFWLRLHEDWMSPQCRKWICFRGMFNLFFFKNKNKWDLRHFLRWS